MNRIVIIGTGYDLDHGMKTRYEDFFYWYWEQRINNLVNEPNEKFSEDVLCKLKCIGYETWLLALMYDMDLKYAKGKKVYEHIIKSDKYKIDFSPFFERITKSIEIKGWVDIENEYYSLLFQERMSLKEGRILPNFKFINYQLDYLRLKLIQYLKNESENDTPVINEIKDKIYSSILKREVALESKRKYDYRNPESNSTDRIMLLNFNYTKTPEKYISGHNNVIVNYIHGQLDYPQSVIFGYGDELDDGYEKLKNYNDNECLRYIKSIRYLESDNYRKMLEFIESAPFQVCIMGHSCGNSDRTLLNTLFEHRNCVSVKPYYYKKEDGTDNYLELVQNISRNFTDMKLMRDRVVNKTYCETLL